MINRYFERRTRDQRRSIEIEEIKYYIESRVLSGKAVVKKSKSMMVVS